MEKIITNTRTCRFFCSFFVTFSLKFTFNRRWMVVKMCVCVCVCVYIYIYSIGKENKTEGQ